MIRPMVCAISQETPRTSGLSVVGAEEEEEFEPVEAVVVCSTGNSVGTRSLA